MNTWFKYKGITAVETVIYLAIFSAIFITMIQYMFSIGKNNQLAEDTINLEKNALFITQHMRDSFMTAESINVASSTFNNDSGVMVLNLDDSANPPNVQYLISSNRAKFRNSAGQNIDITQTDILITRLRFEEILDSDDNLVGARAIYTLISEDTNVTKDFETSFIIRSAL